MKMLPLTSQKIDVSNVIHYCAFNLVFVCKPESGATSVCSIPSHRYIQILHMYIR
jgi:hypothetical protein